MGVAPLAGAWIEIPLPRLRSIGFLSLLSRERGLKYYEMAVNVSSVYVAPLAGAWIEINGVVKKFQWGGEEIPMGW